jgi:hypothetical protein
LMSDEKEGRARTSYRMVVIFMYGKETQNKNTVFLTPPEIEGRRFL